MFEVISLAVVMGLIVGVIISNPPIDNSRRSSSSKGRFAAPDSDLAQEVMVAVDCACGCNLTLISCHCDSPNGSIEMKGFINRLAREGLTKGEIIRRVKEKFKV